MVGFNGILDIIWVENLKMMKDKLIGGKELLVDLRVFYLDLLKMVKIHLKLDKFYCIVVMN